MALHTESQQQKRFLLKPEKWNQQEVTVVGSSIVVILNGNLILDADLSKIDTFMADKKTSWD